jgi:hypothetical protein
MRGRDLQPQPLIPKSEIPARNSKYFYFKLLETAFV